MKKRKGIRYNLKEVIDMQKTIRCKILAIIGWIFNININMPEYEWRARLENNKKCKLGTKISKGEKTWLKYKQ